MQPKYRQLFRRSWHLLGGTIAAILILSAMSFSALRFLLPLAPGYTDHIERSVAAHLADYAEVNVQIGELTTDWRWFRPRLRFINVALTDTAAGHSLFAAEELILGLNLFYSIVERRIVVDDITVIGTHLSLERNQAKQLIVQGIALQNSVVENNTADFRVPELLKQRNIHLIDSTIDIKEQALDIDYRLHDVDLSLYLTDTRHRLYANIELPGRLGQRLQFAAELDGSLAQIENLSGELYIKGEAIDLAHCLQRVGEWLSLKPATVESGQIDFALWVDLDKQQHQLSAWVDVLELSIKLPDTTDSTIFQDERWSLDRLHVDISGSLTDDQFNLYADKLAVVINNSAWPDSAMQIEGVFADDKTLQQLALAMDFARLQDLQPLLSLQADWSRGLAMQLEHLGVLKIYGDLHQLQMQWAQQQPGVYLLSEFADAGLLGGDAIPSVTGLSGQLLIHQQQMVIDLDTENAEFEYSRYFTNSLSIKHLQGRVFVDYADDVLQVSSRDLRLNTPHIQTQHWFDFTASPQQTSHIDAYAIFNNGDVSATRRYLPNKLFKNDLRNWLNRAFVSGHIDHGELELRGDLTQFPFTDNNGVFRVAYVAKDGILQYMPDWPVASDIQTQMLFHGTGMYAHIYSAKIQQANIQDVQLRIPNLKKAIFELEGQAYGSVQDGLDFVRNSGLRKIFSPVIQQTQGNGTHFTRLELQIPLYDKQRREPLFNGSTVVHKTQLEFTDWGLKFDAINARFDYNQNAVTAQPFTAVFDDQELTVALQTRDQTIYTRMHGSAALSSVIDTEQSSFLQNIVGISQWQLELAIPTQSRLPRLTLSSDLQGVAIKLPHPFAKTASQSKPVKLSFVHQSDQTLQARIQYADWLHGVGILTSQTSAQPSAVQLQHADIRINAGQPILPAKPGIRINGRLDKLNLDAWQALLNLDNQQSSELLNSIQHIELQFGQLRYLTHTVDNIVVVLNQDQRNWQLYGVSDVLRGQVLIPKAGFGKRGLVINMEYLDVDRINQGGNKLNFSPKTIPPLQLSAETLLLNSWTLNGVKLLVAPTASGLAIHSLRIEDPSIGLLGSGNWTVNAAGQHASWLKLQLESNDLGVGMANFDYAQTIEGGHGQAQIDVRWADSPFKFDVNTLQGNVEIALREGQILNIDPGGGRLLGLLSLQTIPRRLALDFSDVVGKGFRFDKMDGSFLITKGNAYTDNYYIDGPIGRIDISGRIGLQQRDYEQDILFKPDLSSSLPILGTVLGGPVGGVAVILGDQIARLFGKQADDLARIKYRLTGSWEEPEIIRINQQTKN